MNNIGKIKLRDINELRVSKDSVVEEIGLEQTTPKQTPKKAQRKKKGAAAKPEAATTGGKKAKLEEPSTTDKNNVTRSKTTSKKEPPPNQKRIDAFFKSCSKTYKIEEDTSNIQDKMQARLSVSVKKGKTRVQAETTKKRARKRLYKDDDETENADDFVATTTKTTRTRRQMTRKVKAIKKSETAAVESVIDLCTDSETEGLAVLLPINLEVNGIQIKSVEEKTSVRLSTISALSAITRTMPNSARGAAKSIASTAAAAAALPTPSTSRKNSNMSSIRKTKDLSPIVDNIVVPPPHPSTTKTRTTMAAAPTATKIKKCRPCPPYKIIAGTTFAVDAFQYGQIEGVTHYFLTHFHMDHYVGLTRKFAMPLYLSSLTARLVRAFIPPEEKYLHEMQLNEPQIIENVEVTAIEANHCPGAVMLVFKLTTGKCILHTGDFRACGEMESEPIFWNNDIHTIYLDTTYISSKYKFCTQHESIDRAKALVTEFRAKHADKRILYICGSYVIGKEKFWAAIANEFQLKVWTEDNRKKALQAMQLEELQGVLCDNPLEANMHVITLGKINYLTLADYFLPYSNHFDILLALRPSGWETNSKPRYGRQINIIGIEYSEHSGYNELQRFVTYLKPCEVISTVPVGGGRDMMTTSKVPQKWYKYDKLSSMCRNYQPAITSFLKLNTKNTPNTKTSASGSSKLANCYVSPMKSSKSQFSYVSQEKEPTCSKFVIPPFKRTLATPKIATVMDTQPAVEIIDLDADAEDDWMS